MKTKRLERWHPRKSTLILQCSAEKEKNDGRGWQKGCGSRGKRTGSRGLDVTDAAEYKHSSGLAECQQTGDERI